MKHWTKPFAAAALALALALAGCTAAPGQPASIPGAASPAASAQPTASPAPAPSATPVPTPAPTPKPITVEEVKGPVLQFYDSFRDIPFVKLEYGDFREGHQVCKGDLTKNGEPWVSAPGMMEFGDRCFTDGTRLWIQTYTDTDEGTFDWFVVCFDHFDSDSIWISYPTEETEFFHPLENHLFTHADGYTVYTDDGYSYTVDPCPLMEQLPDAAYFTSPDFLTDEQLELYQTAEEWSRWILGGSANLTGTWKWIIPTPEDVPEGYELYEMPYEKFYNRVHTVFTEEYLSGTDFYEKFKEYNGNVIANVWITNESPEGTTIKVMETYPDTYRPGRSTSDCVEFTLISHYDRNGWDGIDNEIEVYTIEYPIRMIHTGDGWRIDEFHTTYYG